VPVVLVIGIVAILIGVFVVATGRGGELAYEHADHAPLDLGVISATDVALLRPPTALWGYNMQVTDEALDRIARSVRDRDIEIAFLRRKLADLGEPIIGHPIIGEPIIAGPLSRPEPAEPVEPVEPVLAEQTEQTPADIESGTTARDEVPTEEPADDSIAAAEEQGW